MSSPLPLERVPILGKLMIQARWPGFRNGRLLLSLPEAWFTPVAAAVEWQGLTLRLKREFHVTLLNQSLATRLRAALGEPGIKQCFDEQLWTISRTGDGALLRSDKLEGKHPTLCTSIIEHIDVAALHRFRRALAHASGIKVPSVPAHVTLYAGGKSKGIGLADLEALGRAQVDTFRLPGIGNRTAPPLQEHRLAAYRAALYALDALDTSVRIGAVCPVIDAELARRNVDRAAIVTAFNPFSEKANAAGNELRQQWLLAVLQQEGLEVVEAEGRDPEGHWSPEPSVLVFGTSPELEDRLLRDFEQHALVVVKRDAPARLVLHPDQPPRSR